MVVLAGSSTDSSEVLCKRKSTGVHIQSAEIVVRSFSQVRQLIQVFILVSSVATVTFPVWVLVIPCGNIVVILAFF